MSSSLCKRLNKNSLTLRTPQILLLPQSTIDTLTSCTNPKMKTPSFYLSVTTQIVNYDFLTTLNVYQVNNIC